MKLNKDGTVPKKLLTKLQRLAAKKAGNITEICKGLGIARATFYVWLNDHADFKQVYDESSEVVGDLAESMLVKNITNANQRAVEYYLNNRRPDKWKSRHQHEVNANITGEVKVDYDDPNLRAEIERIQKQLGNGS